MKKIITIIVLLLSLLSPVGSKLTKSTFAAEETGHQTILPTEGKNCDKVMAEVNKNLSDSKKAIASGFEIAGATPNQVLGCGIKTGDIKFFMIPFYIKYILEFIIYIVGFLSILGVIYGGYKYLFAGISEDKDSGKNAIKNSLIGLVLSLLAWPIVNIVLALLT